MTIVGPTTTLGALVSFSGPRGGLSVRPGGRIHRLPHFRYNINSLSDSALLRYYPRFFGAHRLFSETMGIITSASKITPTIRCRFLPFNHKCANRFLYILVFVNIKTWYLLQPVMHNLYIYTFYTFYTFHTIFWNS